MPATPAPYLVMIMPSALKELASLPNKQRRQVDELIRGLAANPRPPWSRKLKGSAQGLYRVDSGDYRAVYQIADVARKVMVTKIGDRKDVYRGM